MSKYTARSQLEMLTDIEVGEHNISDAVYGLCRVVGIMVPNGRLGP